MRKRLGLFCACLLMAGPAWADTMVTWQADGQITSNHIQDIRFTAAPVGTPVSVTLMFNPAQATTTPNGGSTRCMVLPVSASLSIGDVDYTATGLGFTQAMLPGSNCSPGSGITQFSLHNLQQPAESSWSPLSGGVLIFDYRDLLVQDAFPNQPTVRDGINSSLFYTGLTGFSPWTFSSGLTFREIEQPAAVPEPATFTLLGLGLAMVARRRHSQQPG